MSRGMVDHPWLLECGIIPYKCTCFDSAVADIERKKHLMRSSCRKSELTEGSDRICKSISIVWAQLKSLNSYISVLHNFDVGKS